MPRPGPRRPIIAIRLDQPTIDDIDALALIEGVNRSEVIRRLIDRGIRRPASPRPRT